MAGMECKGGEASVFPALAQGCVMSTNFCIKLLNEGIAREQCIIPVIANNGLTMVFGATILLADSFPTFIPLSKQLDLLDYYENKTSSAYLQKIVDHCNSLAVLKDSSCQTKIVDMKLNLSSYHIKILNDDVYERGLGLFCHTGSKNDVQPCLNHMIRALNMLYNSGARNYVDFLISIRSSSAASIRVAKTGVHRTVGSAAALLRCHLQYLYFVRCSSTRQSRAYLAGYAT